MATYLLAWNPKRWPWDDLAEWAQRVATGEEVIDRWGCGHSRRIKVGDRVFLIRLGLEPKGIIASGYVTEPPLEHPHWGEAEAAAGKTVRLVAFQYDVLLNPARDAILPRQRLLHDPQLDAMHWDTQMSGVRIPDPIAAALEAAWAEHIGAAAS